MEFQEVGPVVVEVQDTWVRRQVDKFKPQSVYRSGQGQKLSRRQEASEV